MESLAESHLPQTGLRPDRQMLFSVCLKAKQGFSIVISEPNRTDFDLLSLFWDTSPSILDFGPLAILSLPAGREPFPFWALLWQYSFLF